MSIGDRIRTLRKTHNLSQIQLAKMAGIAVNSLRLYEANKREPKIDAVGKLAQALGVSKAEILGWDHDPSILDEAVLELYPGYNPNEETIPEYLARTGKNPRPASESGSKIDDPELVEILEQMKNRSEMRMLFKLATNASAEDVRRAINIIEALRKEE